VTLFEGYELALLRANGFGPRTTSPPGGTLLLVLRGAVLIETEDGGARLEAGEMTVAPEGTAYSLSAPEAAVLARLQREDGSKPPSDSG